MRDAESAAEQLPLQGLLVLDFSQFLSGPSCALRLADLGARVIKVEHPKTGDSARSLLLADQRLGAESQLFHTINRNKQSYAADLKDPAARARILRLIDRADVLIHNFRPGVMERLGLDYRSLSERAPRLVYASISGYGADGPWRDRPGQDLLVQSLSGLAWLSGNSDQPPVPAGISITDMAAGAQLAQGILALLFRRERTGRGGHVESSLLEAAIDLQFESITAYLNGGGLPQRSRVSSANPYLAAPYGLFRASDGYLAIAMTPPLALARLLGSETLAAIPAADWFERRDEVKEVIGDIVAARPRSEILALLEKEGLWCAPVLAWDELCREPAFAAADPLQEIANEVGERMVTTRCPIRVDGQVLRSPLAAPALGRDTQRIDAELAPLEAAAQ